MSSWQSFFNQLSNTAKKGENGSFDIICQCEKGNLTIVNDSDFKTSSNCSRNFFCSTIQIDKYRAKKFNNKISIISLKAGIKTELNCKAISVLDHILE